MLREYGPVVLVPAAWLTASASIAGIIGTQPLLIAHAVILVALAAFLRTSWQVMHDDPVLRTWAGIMAGGLIATAAGAAAFTLPVCSCLFTAALGYWMLAPGIGLLVTAAYCPERFWDYTIAGTLSLLGLTHLTTGSNIGLLLVGAGQTMGIVTAAVQDGMP